MTVVVFIVALAINTFYDYHHHTNNDDEMIKSTSFIIYQPVASKQVTLTQRWFTVGPPSATLYQQ